MIKVRKLKKKLFDYKTGARFVNTYIHYIDKPKNKTDHSL